MTENDLPKAIGNLISPGSDFKDGYGNLFRASGWLFKVKKCPFCEKIHIHNWQPDKTRSRLSHCMGRKLRGKKGYSGGGEYILTPEGESS